MIILRISDHFSRHCSHVNPMQPESFPVVPFEEIMSSEKGVANWTEKIVLFHMNPSQVA